MESVLKGLESLVKSSIPEVKGVDFIPNLYHSEFANRLLSEKEEEYLKGGLFSFDDVTLYVKWPSCLVFRIVGESKTLTNWMSRHKTFVDTVLNVVFSKYIQSKVEEFIQRLSKVREFPEIYNDIIRELCLLTDSTIGGITVYDPSTNYLIGKGKGYILYDLHGDVKIEGVFNFSLTQGTSAYDAFQRKDILIINDTQNYPNILKSFLNYYKVDRVIVIPLFDNGNIFGAIYLGRFKGLMSYTNFEYEICKKAAPLILTVLKILKFQEDAERRQRALLFVKDLSENVLTEASLLKIFDIANEYFKVVLKVEKCAFFSRNTVELELLYNSGFDRQELKFVAGLIQEINFKRDSEYCFTCLLNEARAHFSALMGISFLIEDEEIIGVLGSKTRGELSEEEINLIRIFLSSAKVAAKNLKLYEKSVETLDKIIETLAQLESKKDRFTASHSMEVAEFALKIADALGLDAEEKKHVYIGGLLHDLGKVVVERAVLLKDGPLSQEEWEEIKEHPLVGMEILKNVPGLEKAASYIATHHERYDGTGYPKRLSGESIPLGGRIIAIADSVLTMLSDRPYRKALNLDQVIFELVKEKGKQFDPQLVDVVINLLKRDGGAF